MTGGGEREGKEKERFCGGGDVTTESTGDIGTDIALESVLDDVV